MILSEQIRIVFFSYIYGILYYAGYFFAKKITLKRKILSFLLYFILCITFVIIFFALVYRINNMILNYYMIICFFLGIITCRLVYFNDKK